ncbi:MAG: hypothetical protein BME94_07095 [Methanobacteriales archaeon Met13]
MDQKGFIFTFDAVLALIPLFLVIALVSSLQVPFEAHSQVVISQNAHDYLDILASSQVKDRSVMESMVQVLNINHNNDTGVEEAREILKPVMDNLMVGTSYQLMETSQLNGTIIISQGDLKSSSRVATATRNWGNYTFILLVGE